jgi:hypothetical protein
MVARTEKTANGRQPTKNRLRTDTKFTISLYRIAKPYRNHNEFIKYLFGERFPVGDCRRLAEFEREECKID